MECNQLNDKHMIVFIVIASEASEWSGSDYYVLMATPDLESAKEKVRNLYIDEIESRTDTKRDEIDDTDIKGFEEDGMIYDFDDDGWGFSIYRDGEYYTEHYSVKIVEQELK